MNSKNYYEVLKVSRTAPKEIIKAVYKAWMFALKAHPDFGGDEEWAKLIGEAYEVLSDTKKRAAYDASLSLKKEDAESRRAPRYAVDASVLCLLGDSGDWFEAKVLDASVAGLRIECFEKISKGDRLLVSFPIYVKDAVETRVMWTKSTSAKRCEAGIEFFTPFPSVLKCLGYGDSKRSAR